MTTQIPHILFAAALMLPFVVKGQAQQPVYLTEAAKVLGKYAEGNRTLNDLKPGGKFASIRVLFLPAEQIVQRAGHNGGGVKQNPNTKEYEILIREDLPVDQKAHALSHELQHIRDENAFDQFLEANPDLNALGPKVIRGLRSPEGTEFIRNNREDVDFVLKGLFCQEARAYKVNRDLANQGLPFQNKIAIENLGTYINDAYIKKFGVSYDLQVDSMASECTKAKSFVDYMRTIVPSRFKTKTSQPAAAVK